MTIRPVSAWAAALRAGPTAAASVVLLVALQVLAHPYQGLSGDAELYAVQAMARIHPGLATDVFLRFGSQDEYTIFSPIYAWCIKWLGLRDASAALLFCCKAWLCAASWMLVRALSNGRIAFAAVSLLLVVDGTYGGYAVFRYAEDWLTARSLAEALAVSAIGWYALERRAAGVLLALLAFFVHPIMGLPCLLMLACIRCTVRASCCMAAAAVSLVAGLSLWASHAPTAAGLLAVMDAAWLDIVRERSVFLFPNLWGTGDWWTNCRPVLSLALTAVVIRDSRLGKLCFAAGLVGVTGVLIALIAGTFGDIATLVQAQPWRWMWLTCLLSVLLIILAAATACRAGRFGLATATLLVMGWMLPPLSGMTSMVLALAVWSMREAHPVPFAARPRWTAAIVSIALAAAMAATLRETAGGSPVPGEGIAGMLWNVWRIDALPFAAFALVLMLFQQMAWTRPAIVMPQAVIFLGICCAIGLPGTLKSMRRDGALTDIHAFADWRSLIPPTSNVYVAPAHYSAAFAWFTLQRPSYLSVDQSAGVVFSRATAMEIKRRSLVLSPALKPDWQLRTTNAGSRLEGRPQGEVQPFSAENLARICKDPELGFVVATDNPGLGLAAYAPVALTSAWSLYDCARIQAMDSRG